MSYLHQGESTIVPQTRSAPSPRREEGWGEGATDSSIDPNPSPRPSPYGRGSRTECAAMTLISLALAITLAAPPARAADPALYEAAKKEGALVIVGGGPAPPYEKFAHEFMQRYPGIAVAVTGGPSNVHSVEVDKQIAARALRIDLAGGRDSVCFYFGAGEAF